MYKRGISERKLWTEKCEGKSAERKNADAKRKMRMEIANEKVRINGIFCGYRWIFEGRLGQLTYHAYCN